MPPRPPSWLARRIGRALSRHLLRRCLAAQGVAGRARLATVISTRRIGTQQATGRVVVWTDADMTHPNDRIPELVFQVAEVRDVTGPFPWTTIWATLPPR